MEKLTLEDKILGRTEPRPLTELEQTAFLPDTKYKINIIGKDNPTIMNGDYVKNILPLSERRKITDGDKIIEYNGFVIERIEDEEVEEEEAPKPRRRRVNNG